jgi:putative redox protein
MLRRNTPLGVAFGVQAQASKTDAVIAAATWCGSSTHMDQRARGTCMECTVHWVPSAGMAFAAETGSGHVLTMDGAPDGGGRNLAPRPMETLLAGAGGCTAYDVVLILKRGRHAVTGCTVQMKAERAAQDPKVFTRIHLHFKVSGKSLPEAAVQRAIELSHERYCSATIMLAKTAEITTSHEVVEA